MLAQGDAITNPLLPNFSGWSGENFFAKLIPSFLGLAFVVGIIIFVFIMIIGAVQWIISGGDKAAIQAAQGKITNAVIGVVILLSSYAILKLVGDFFGVAALQNFSISIAPLIIK